MPSQPRSSKKVSVDPLQAVKRAFMRRGRFFKASRPPAKEEPEPKEPKEDSPPSPKELTDSDEPQHVHEKLIDITEKAQDVLFKADTVFPFTLFPDTITLDREKLTVATRYFFRTAKIVSVPVSSISSAEADVGVFFGSLLLASKFFTQNTYRINFLTRQNAMHVQHLLQGFIIAQEKDIDVTDIDKEDLLLLLNDLGQGVSE